ncbi:PREDICTED: nucleolin 1-like [Nicotiana attenuata]|uniref:nucleolin 1-like n=1 Tax=Nicotiana attenuata TaxID=49451 RepID=UPI000904699E|nr:PREDICTED: nucleolin 1-like [Nicotiana attenuata]
MCHEEHSAQGIANEKEKRENEGESRDDKESDSDDKIGEQVNDSVEEENHTEEEDNSESEGEDPEKVSESEGVGEESEKESDNLSEEFEGSMTIGNTVIAPSEETSEEKRTQQPGPLLTPFTGDKEVSSDKDDLPLSEVEKKPRKTPVKSTKSSVPIRK